MNCGFVPITDEELEKAEEAKQTRRESPKRKKSKAPKMTQEEYAGRDAFRGWLSKHDQKVAESRKQRREGLDETPT